MIATRVDAIGERRLDLLPDLGNRARRGSRSGHRPACGQPLRRGSPPTRRPMPRRRGARAAGTAARVIRSPSRRPRSTAPSSYPVIGERIARQRSGWCLVGEPGLLGAHVPAGDREAQDVARVSRGTVGESAGEPPHVGVEHRHLGHDVVEFGEADRRIRSRRRARRCTPGRCARRCAAEPAPAGPRERRRRAARGPSSRRAGRVAAAGSRRAPWRPGRPTRQSPAAVRRSSTRSSSSQVKSGSSRPKWP